MKTLTQAQDEYVSRVNSCHTGHIRRVRRAARSELWDWAESKGYDPRIVCKDAEDMAELERLCDD